MNLILQGDTLENVSTDLDCVMETGFFKLVIKPKRITGTSKMDSEVAAEHNSGVLLHYQPTMTSFLQKRRLQTLSESDENFLQAPAPQQIPCVAETWTNEQIDDFVRKLGFLEAQGTDVDETMKSSQWSNESTGVEQKVKLFQQLNQVAY